MRIAQVVALATFSLFAPSHAGYATEPAAPKRFHQVHAAMGTGFALDLYTADEAKAAQVMDLVFEEIDRLEALLSNYRPSSELSRIGREAGEHAVTTDPETFSFLQRSLFWSRESDGAFDITVGPLLRAWGFFGRDGRVPTASEMSALRTKVGWQRVRLDAVDRSIVFVPGRPLELDPGSIGKGFAVDRAVALLREQGISAALLSAGNSTVYALGAPPGSNGWPVRVMDPRRPGVLASVLELRDSSLSTGACTEKFFVLRGHRYCHIFDPRTLHPVEGVLQSSVIDPSATDSDALSTVAFVLPPKSVRELLRDRAGTKVLVFRGPSPHTSCDAIHWPGDPCHKGSQTNEKDRYR